MRSRAPKVGLTTGNKVEGWPIGSEGLACLILRAA